MDDEVYLAKVHCRCICYIMICVYSVFLVVFTGGQNKVKNNVLKNDIFWLFHHPKVVLKCSSGIARQLTCTRMSALH